MAMKDCIDNGITPYIPQYASSRKYGMWEFRPEIFKGIDSFTKKLVTDTSVRLVMNSCSGLGTLTDTESE